VEDDVRLYFLDGFGDCLGIHHVAVDPPDFIFDVNDILEIGKMIAAKTVQVDVLI